jgi:hypothetical protein
VSFLCVVSTKENNNNSDGLYMYFLFLMCMYIETLCSAPLENRTDRANITKSAFSRSLQLILPVGAGNQTDSDWSKSRSIPERFGQTPHQNRFLIRLVKPMTKAVVARQARFCVSGKNFGLHLARP